jgi:hypothetical protein
MLCVCPSGGGDVVVFVMVLVVEGFKVFSMFCYCGRFRVVCGT